MKTTFDRRAAAYILWRYREAVRENVESPTRDNWEDVKRNFNRVAALAIIGVISELAQMRAMSMFEKECTAVL